MRQWRPVGDTRPRADVTFRRPCGGRLEGPHSAQTLPAWLLPAPERRQPTRVGFQGHQQPTCPEDPAPGAKYGPEVSPFQLLILQNGRGHE